MNNNYQYSKDETILKVKNVSLKFGDALILRDINLEVKNIVRPNMCQGQIIGLLAPSGMGKTQLFEILSGIKPPTTGTVEIGNPLQPVKIGNVGVVAQNYPLFLPYTVGKNLMVAAKKNTRLKTDEERELKVKEMLDLFHLSDHADKYQPQLSGGQRQRVAIAQQMLCSETFLLLDEPFSGLDPLMVKKVIELIIRIANYNEHNTIILVTHDITAAALISDTLWIMGRDLDGNGTPIPGATIKYAYDLIELGLAWRPDIEYTPQFTAIVKEIKQLFEVL